MFERRCRVAALLAVVIMLVLAPPSLAQSPKAAAESSAADDRRDGEIRQLSESLARAFNGGKSADVAAFFLTAGELIDESGNVYQGPVEIRELLDQFFQKFPGAAVAIETESIRFVGPVAIQEGFRTTTVGDVTSRVQFTCVLSKTGEGWSIVSLRDFPEATVPTAGEQLQSLSWLIGEWVNEGADARVRIQYQWSEDRNFLLGEFHVIENDKVVSKSTQRIGWDPLLGKPRSWLFDSDGGFSEAVWTSLADGQWILRSTAVLPEGTTGSATLTIQPDGVSRFVYSGSSRLVGDALEDDFKLTIVRKPPTAGVSK